jgi:hypothetical protein
VHPIREELLSRGASQSTVRRRRIHNDRASISASSRQCACPFYSFCAGFFFGKASHHPDLSAPLQPRFGSLRLLAFPNAKMAVDREIC